MPEVIFSNIGKGLLVFKTVMNHNLNASSNLKSLFKRYFSAVKFAKRYHWIVKKWHTNYAMDYHHIHVISYCLV